MQALLASPTMVRLMLTSGRRSTVFVVLLPVVRPSTLFGLLVSRLERPSILKGFAEPTAICGANRLIIPDSTRAAARIASRVGPLVAILLLPVTLIGLFRVASNARMLPELRVFKLFCARTGLGIVRTTITIWGDLGPLIPLPNQLSSSITGRSAVGTEVDLSRQDLPRIALLRRGERQDLLFLTFAYALFVSICAQGFVIRQGFNFRWFFRLTLYCVVLYVLGGDGIADFLTALST